MNDTFNEQKDFLLRIKHEISLLHQQVDYLIRNEQPLGLLDLDVMMNRTHTIYDLMCSINAECGTQDAEAEGDDQELPVGMEQIRSLFGMEEEPKDEEDELDEDEATQPESEEDQNVEENEDAYFIEEIDDVPEEEPQPQSLEDSQPQEELKPEEEESKLEPEAESQPEPEKESTPEPEPQPEEVTKPEPIEEPKNENADDMGFILNFEPVGSAVFTTGDEIEMTIPHIDVPAEEEPHAAPEEEIVYEPVVIGDMDDHDDGGFEIESDTVETVGERYQQEQEPTLGEKLQQHTVKDLQKAIGINDKFLFVNELFGGSMEKYNRSIENLNDLKTLNGALIYLNELRIELQWNSNNEAYKKLLTLVHNKYEG